MMITAKVTSKTAYWNITKVEIHITETYSNPVSGLLVLHMPEDEAKEYFVGDTVYLHLIPDDHEEDHDYYERGGPFP